MKKFFCNGKKDFCDVHEACPLECPHASGTGGYYKEVKPTYADRIRAMTDEELAKFIVGNAVGEEYQTYEYEFSIENVRYFNVDYTHQGETAEESVLYWLQQPAEGE